MDLVHGGARPQNAGARERRGAPQGYLAGRGVRGHDLVPAVRRHAKAPVDPGRDPVPMGGGQEDGPEVRRRRRAPHNFAGSGLAELRLGGARIVRRGGAGSRGPDWIRPTGRARYPDHNDSAPYMHPPQDTRRCGWGRRGGWRRRGRRGRGRRRGPTIRLPNATGGPRPGQACPRWEVSGGSLGIVLSHSGGVRTPSTARKEAALVMAH